MSARGGSGCCWSISARPMPPMSHRSSVSLANSCRIRASSRFRRSCGSRSCELLILNLRPRTTAANYAKVWTPEGSPITAITRKQAEALHGAFGSNVVVDWAMRYGTRSIAERLKALMDAGCDRILLAPMYPQYSAATNATVVDAANAAIADWRWQPALRTLPPYYDNQDHIGALAQSVIDGSRRPGFRAATDRHQLSRHAQAHARSGRSLSLSMPENRAIAAGWGMSVGLVQAFLKKLFRPRRVAKMAGEIGSAARGSWGFCCLSNWGEALNLVYSLSAEFRYTLSKPVLSGLNM